MLLFKIEQNIPGAAVKNPYIYQFSTSTIPSQARKGTGHMNKVPGPALHTLHIDDLYGFIWTLPPPSVTSSNLTPTSRKRGTHPRKTVTGVGTSSPCLLPQSRKRPWESSLLRCWITVLDSRACSHGSLSWVWGNQEFHKTWLFPGIRVVSFPSSSPPSLTIHSQHYRQHHISV